MPVTPDLRVFEMCLAEVTSGFVPPAPVEDSVEPDAPVPAEPEVPVPFTSWLRCSLNFVRVAGELVKVRFLLDH